MSENNKHDRMSESDWTHMGPEDAVVKLRNDNLVPDGIRTEDWVNLSPGARSFIWDRLRLKAPRRRSQTPPRTGVITQPRQERKSP